MNDAPDLDIIGTGAPCDLNRYACNSVNLYGENFAEVENLTCHYRNLAVSPAMIIHLEFSCLGEIFNTLLSEWNTDDIFKRNIWDD